MCSCEFESDDMFYDATAKKYKVYDYYEDEYGNKGVVVLVASRSSELAYMVVISLDESYEAWGPMNLGVYSTDSVSRNLLKGPRFGLFILRNMKAMGIDRFPAQAWCDQKNYKEEIPHTGSWRLPTSYEFKLIFGNHGERLATVNAAIGRAGGTRLDKNKYYWTCIEDYTGYISFPGQTVDYDYKNRAFMTSPNGYTYTNKDLWLKKNANYVRAIKYIYYKD